MKIRAMLITVLVAGTSVVFADEIQAPPQSNPAQSDTKTPVINQRQKNHHARIKQGVKSGELTKGEARKLHGEEKTIQTEKQMSKVDGKVTPAERAKIRKDQRKASKDIYRLKHNDKTQKNPQGDAK
jgi:hypothetical protein